MEVSRLGIVPEEGIKAPVRVETTAPITLSGHQTINGHLTVSGDRVLVKDQTLAKDNGIYNALDGDWKRASDMDRPEDVQANVWIVSQQTGLLYEIDVPPGTYWNPNATDINFNQVAFGGEWGTIIGTLSNQTDLQAALDLKTDDTSFTTHTGDGTIHFTQAAISITLAQVSDSGTAAALNTGLLSGDIPVLGAGGLLNTSVLPPLSITSTFVVASEVAQLALTVEEGDVAVRTDQNQSYIALNDTNATMADWQLLLTPTDAVLSVDGQTGVVVLDYIGGAIADNQIAVGHATSDTIEGNSGFTYQASTNRLDIDALTTGSIYFINNGDERITWDTSTGSIIFYQAGQPTLQLSGTNDVSMQGGNLIVGDTTATNGVVSIRSSGATSQLIDFYLGATKQSEIRMNATTNDLELRTQVAGREIVILTDLGFEAMRWDANRDTLMSGYIASYPGTPVDRQILTWDGTNSRAEFTNAGSAVLFKTGTPVATTAGTEFDFAIPAGVTEFALNVDGISLSGTDEFLVQLGDSGGIEVTGYDSGCIRGLTTVASSSSTAGFNIFQTTDYVLSGTINGKLIDASTNTWIITGRTINTGNDVQMWTAGRKSLSGELTTVRLTRSGTDTFDAGSINIQHPSPDPVAPSANVFVNGVPQDSTGTPTELDFTIPVGVKKITVAFDELSHNGTSTVGVQLGDSTIVTTGYNTRNAYLTGATGQGTSLATSGFFNNNTNSGHIYSGLLELTLLDESTNTWACSGQLGSSLTGNYMVLIAGSVDLSSALQTVRVTTSGGTAGFDSGKVNVNYENQEFKSMPAEGKVVQQIYNENNAAESTTGTFTFDDNIPQNTGGKELLTATITPSSTSNYLLIEVQIAAPGNSAANANFFGGVFRDSEADCVAGMWKTLKNGISNTGYTDDFVLRRRIPVVSASPQTYKIRYGCTSGTTDVNGRMVTSTPTRLAGGVMVSSITITEIAA